jgi:hypothetical protein
VIASYGFTYETYRDKVFVGLWQDEAWFVVMRVMPASGELVGRVLDSDMRPIGREAAILPGRLLESVAVASSQDRVEVYRDLHVVL